MKKSASGYTLNELAAQLQAELCGDPDHIIKGVATVENAKVDQITFISDAAYRRHLSTTQAGAVIVPEDLRNEYGGNRLVVDNPYLSYARLSGLFCRRNKLPAGVHPTAAVDPSARVHESAAIGPHCIVEADCDIGAGAELGAGVFIGSRSQIGSDCLLYPKVTIYHDVRLGERVTIHAASVIGSDGFGFAPTAEGWEKIYQLGGVVVGNNVEIGAGCTIDRGAITNTEIGNGVIIDNQVHIAHNVKIGERTAIAGCCGIAGSTEIGARCLLGGGVLINGHLKVCDDVKFNGASVVTKSIREPGAYSSGTPLQPVKLWQKTAVRVGQLNPLFERVRNLENQLNTKPETGDER